jgi:hypothetical protein
MVYLDIEGAENRYGMEPVEALTPAKNFDARWAMDTAFVREEIGRTIQIQRNWTQSGTSFAKL